MPLSHCAIPHPSGTVWYKGIEEEQEEELC